MALSLSTEQNVLLHYSFGLWWNWGIKGFWYDMFFVNTFLATLLTVCNTTFDVSVITPLYFSSYKSSASLRKTSYSFFYFESVKSFLHEEVNLPNNYSHVDIECRYRAQHAAHFLLKLCLCFSL